MFQPLGPRQIPRELNYQVGMSSKTSNLSPVVFSDDTRIAVRILNACSQVIMSEIVRDLLGVLAEVTAIT